METNVDQGQRNEYGGSTSAVHTSRNGVSRSAEHKKMIKDTWTLGDKTRIYRTLGMPPRCLIFRGFTVSIGFT